MTRYIAAAARTALHLKHRLLLRKYFLGLVGALVGALCGNPVWESFFVPHCGAKKVSQCVTFKNNIVTFVARLDPNGTYMGQFKSRQFSDIHKNRPKINAKNESKKEAI